MNLALAIFWLLLGAGLILWHWWDPGQDFLRIHGTRLSAGWLAVLLGLYNVLRWRLGRLSRSSRRAEDAWPRRRDRPRRDPPPEPDPTFDFRDPPH